MIRNLMIVPLALALIVTACGGNDDDDQQAQAAADAPVAAQAQENDDDAANANEAVANAIAGIEGLAEELFPDALIYPESAFESAFAVGENRAIVLLNTPDSVEDILDFYEDTFEAVGLGDDGERAEAGDLGSYSVGDDETGSGVIVEGGSAGKTAEI